MLDVINEGVVSEVDAEKHAVRVTYPDKNNLVSGLLPVITLFAYNNKSYALPEVGERVLVVSASNGGMSGGGYVVGSLYTADNKPTTTDENIYRLEITEDEGTTAIEYNKTDKMFSVVFSDGEDSFKTSYDKTAKEYKLEFADGSSVVQNEEELAINCKGELNIESVGKINITAKDEINIESSQDVNINARNIRLN